MTGEIGGAVQGDTPDTIARKLYLLESYENTKEHFDASKWVQPGGTDNYYNFCLGGTGIFTPKSVCERRQEAKLLSREAEAAVTAAQADMLRALAAGEREEAMGLDPKWVIGGAAGSILLLAIIALIARRR